MRGPVLNVKRFANLFMFQILCFTLGCKRLMQSIMPFLGTSKNNAILIQRNIKYHLILLTGHGGGSW